jgi:hypothetical protein
VKGGKKAQQPSREDMGWQFLRDLRGKIVPNGNFLFGVDKISLYGAARFF